MGILRTETFNPPATEVFTRILTPDVGKKFDSIKINDIEQIIANPLSYVLSVPAGEEEVIVDLCQIDEVVVPAGFTINIQNSSRVQLRIGSYAAIPLPAGQNATLTRQAGQSAEIWLSPIFGANIIGINVNGVPETGVNPYEKTVDYGLTISNIQGNKTVIITDDLIANLTHKITINAGVGGSTNKAGVNFVPHNTNFSFTVTPNSGYQINQITPSNGSNFTITNPAGQTSQLNGVTGSMSIDLSFSTVAVLPFYTNILNNLQILANNDVKALLGTNPKARSRRTLVAKNGGVRFRINYSYTNHFIACNNIFAAGLSSDFFTQPSPQSWILSNLTSMDFIFLLQHTVQNPWINPYTGASAAFSTLDRTTDVNSYNNPSTPNPPQFHLFQQETRINGVVNSLEFIYNSGATYEVFINNNNDVEFKVNNVLLKTSRVKAYPSPSTPFYFDLTIFAQNADGAAGGISDIQLLGTWTS